ncbi:hypothetical protein OSB04_013994 [Centaurea solstitialis]|uniref:TF-B3 domain-containing protein n=1 Tax=Centaurea solstitialis TaxID=347529 RepID=A0AA38TEA8_9ASTR|nr:hypothetical protein OSB04_013994 [Centaurea solstitialis]
MADTPTHFFKFIRSTSNLNVSIPTSFLPNSKVGRCLQAILRRGAHQWPVDITGGGFSGDGWKKCLNENGVQEFDFMVFKKHQGNMVFDFWVFDPSTFEKQYPNPTAEMDGPDQTESESENEDNHRLGDDRCFVSKITPYYIKSTRLASVPMKFARSNGLTTKRKRGQVIIKDENGRKWPASLDNNNKMQMRISVCRDFKVKNHLKVGDRCKFELVKSGEVLVFDFYNIGKKLIKNSTRVKENNSTIKKVTRSTSNDHRRKEYFVPKEEPSLCEEEDDQQRPYFVGKLKSSSFTLSILYLPMEFSKKNGLFYNGEIILNNGKDDRSWIVELKNHKDKYCYIGRGWKDFCVANGLEEGDRFKLQIIDSIGEKPITRLAGKRHHRQPEPTFSPTRTIVFVVSITTIIATANHNHRPKTTVVVVTNPIVTTTATIKTTANHQRHHHHRCNHHLLHKPSSPLQTITAAATNHRFRHTLVTVLTSIPTSFLPKLKVGSCSKAILRRDDHKWPVDIAGGVLSGDGWKKCLNENGVQKFDFMVFKKHQENMVFDFLVFDPSTCEKHYPNPSSEMDGSDHSESESENEDNHRLGDDRCFMSKITPYYIKSTTLASVPRDFARSNGLTTKRTRGQVIIKDEKGRKWPAAFYKSKMKMRIRLSVSPEFKVKNQLKIGDSCKFELVKSGEIVVFNFYNIGKKPIKDYSRVKKEINSIVKKATRSTSNNHPYYTSTLRPYSFRKSTLYLQLEFAKKNGLFYDGEIILGNGKDDKSWTVELKNLKNKYCYIGRGWKDFRVANGLKEGDRFKLQIIGTVGEKLVLISCGFTETAWCHRNTLVLPVPKAIRGPAVSAATPAPCRR